MYINTFHMTHIIVMAVLYHTVGTTFFVFSAIIIFLQSDLLKLHRFETLQDVYHEDTQIGGYIELIGYYVNMHVCCYNSVYLDVNIVCTHYY